MNKVKLGFQNFIDGLLNKRVLRGILWVQVQDKQPKFYLGGDILLPCQS